MDSVKQRSGKNAAVSVQGSLLNFAKWSADVKGDRLDTVNFESGGVGEGIVGIEEVSTSFGGDWDAGDNPFDDPPGLYPRDDLPDVVFTENTTDNVFWNFDYMFIETARNSAEVRGKVSFETSGYSQGVYDTPTGSV